MVYNKKYNNIFNSTLWKDDYSNKFPNINNKNKQKIIRELLLKRYLVCLSDILDYPTPTFDDPKNLIYSNNKMKIDEVSGKFYLKERVVRILNLRLKKILIEEADLVEEGDKEDLENYNGKFVFNTYNTYKDIQRKEYENNGQADFIDKEIEKREITIPDSSIQTLQCFKIMITSTPFKFDYVYNNAYICPECDESFNWATYKTASTGGAKKCIGVNPLTNGRCNKKLKPDQQNCDKIPMYFYSCIAFDDKKEVLIQVISPECLRPNIYKVSAVSVSVNGSVDNYRIVDTMILSTTKLLSYIKSFNEGKPDDEKFLPPTLPNIKQNIHPIYNMTDFFEYYIKERTGKAIVGMTLLKLSILIQYFGKNLNLTNNIHISAVGPKALGKSFLFEGWSRVFYPGQTKKTGGETLSAPSLRGTAKTEKELILGTEYSVPEKGLLYNYEIIFIDEFGHARRDVMHTLKEFLWSKTFSNNKSDNKNKYELLRKASIMLTENVHGNHLKDYHNMVKELYLSEDNKNIDYSDLDSEDNRPSWDGTWDLFQLVESYNFNPWLKRAIKVTRNHFKSVDKFWMDGHWNPLHDRFIFYFFFGLDISNKKSDKVKTAILDNSSKVFKKSNDKTFGDTFNECMEEITLRSDDFEEIMESYSDYIQVDDDKINTANDKILELFKKYKISYDDETRMLEIYVNVLNIVRIIRRSRSFHQLDYDVIERFLQTYGRAVSLEQINMKRTLTDDEFKELININYKNEVDDNFGNIPDNNVGDSINDDFK